MPRTGKWTEHSRTTYKDRYFWHNQRAPFPLRDAPPAELEKFWAAQRQAESRRHHHWECLGPFNVAGRVTALAIHPRDPDKWFAGSAAGGVWMSRDAGQSWIPAWNRFASQNIGSLAWVHHGGKRILMAGTGEANLSPDSYPGSGIYCSADEALTWGPLFHSEGLYHPGVRKLPRRIGCIASHPRGGIAIASITHDDHMAAGLYFSSGGDSEFAACEFWGTRSYNCHSVLFHPEDPAKVFAAIEPGGSANGIWRSTDGGHSWEHLTRGLPPGDQFRRTTIAMAPSDPDVLYALAADRSNGVLGLFRSADAGNSWRPILHGPGLGQRQMAYNNTLAIHPRHPDGVVWGGMHLFRTGDAGRRWRRISTGDASKRHYLHPDQHAILWVDDEVLISGNDGGVAITENGGRTWSDRSQGMATAMFYDMDVAPSNARVFGGGTQDNGTLIAGVGGAPDGHFVRAVPGDGGWMAFASTHEEQAYASASPFLLYRHDRGKPWEFRHWKWIRPRQIQDLESAQRAIVVLVVERRRRGTARVWAGSSRLWRTEDGGRRWKVVSPVFDGSAVSAIAVADADRRLVFAGTMAGGIFRSRDGGRTWSQNLAGMEMPNRAITAIATHPIEPSVVVATVAATGVTNSGVEIRTGRDKPYGHVFRSEDAGDTWGDIDRGSLPNVVFYAAAYETRPPFRLFVAGDVGVFAEQTGGWADISGNLPNVVVSDLVYHDASHTLTAATYGRGIWRTHPSAEAPQIALTHIASAGWLREDPQIAAPAATLRAGLLEIEPVPGAIGYQAEAVPASGRESFLTSSANSTLAIEVPSGRGRWRVWALFPSGVRSRASEWRRFSHRKPAPRTDPGDQQRDRNRRGNQ